MNEDMNDEDAVEENDMGDDEGEDAEDAEDAEEDELEEDIEEDNDDGDKTDEEIEEEEDEPPAKKKKPVSMQVNNQKFVYNVVIQFLLILTVFIIPHFTKLNAKMLHSIVHVYVFCTTMINKIHCWLTEPGITGRCYRISIHSSRFSVEVWARVYLCTH